MIIAASLDILGGQAVQAAKLVEYLRRENIIDVDFLPINPRLPGLLRKLQRIKYVRTVATSVLYWAKLLTTIPRFDVIHIFSASYISFLIAPTPAIIVSRLFGKRIILNYHSGEAEDHLRRWPKTSIPLLRIADQIVVPSNYLVNVFEKFGLEATAIFNVITLDQFVFRQRHDLRPKFLCNRNFEPHYGVDVVLRAFALIQERFSEASLTVVGDGPCRLSLLHLAADLHLRNVEFKGPVEAPKMAGLYDAADVFLNGSRIDNQPLSILESFASGLPVVTTNAGGIPDMVVNDRTGLVVEMDDSAALAAAAMRLIDEPETTERIVASAFQECRKYSWETVRNQWLSVYTGASVVAEDNPRLQATPEKKRTEQEEICGSS